MVAARSVPDPDAPPLSASPTIAESRTPRTIPVGHFLAHVDGEGTERRVWVFPAGLSARHVTIDPEGNPWIVGTLSGHRALAKLTPTKEARDVFVKLSKQGAVAEAVPFQFSKHPDYPALGRDAAVFAFRGPEDLGHRVADERGGFGIVSIPELLSPVFVDGDGGAVAISGIPFDTGDGLPFLGEDVDVVSWARDGSERFRKRISWPTGGSLGEVLLDVHNDGAAGVAAPFPDPPVGILVTELSRTGAHLYSSTLTLGTSCTVFSFWASSVVLTDEHLVVAANCPSMTNEDGSGVPPRVSIAGFRRRSP